MPINASYEYFAAERKYHEAKSKEDKLKCLQEMLKVAPSHKGGEKLVAEITGKIKKLKDELEKAEVQRKKTASGRSISVKKDGIGQIVLVGMPNSGKSTLLKNLTDADVKIAHHPFTTKKPEIGMIGFKNANIQLVEVPAILQGSSQGKAQGRELLSIVRTADAIVLVLNAFTAVQELKVLQKEIGNVFIELNRRKPKAKVVRSEFKGITVAGGKYLKISKKQLENFLKAHGMHHASLVLDEPVGLAELEEVLNTKLVYKKAIAIVMEENRELGKDVEVSLKKKVPIIRVKEFNEEKVKELKEKLFSMLDVILVHTKKPGDEAAKKPLALKKGSTVEDVAKTIHKDFVKLKYAKVWGSTKFAGQRVAKDYELKEGDVIEISV